MEDPFADDAFEAPVESPEAEVSEGTEVPDETPAEDSAEKAEPEVIDISEFENLVDSFIDRGEDGEVSDELAPESVVAIQASYRDLSRKAKNAARKSLGDKMQNAVVGDDLYLARYYLAIQSKMTETPKVEREKKEKAPVDPTEAYVKQIAKLDLARALIQGSIPVDYDQEGIKARAAELFQKGVEDSQKDEPEYAWVRQAINLAKPKKGGSGTGKAKGERTRHSVATHIAEAFENAAPGESLTIQQILNFKSKEYGEDSPSKQAVMAHLNSKQFANAQKVDVITGDEGEKVLVKR